MTAPPPGPGQVAAAFLRRDWREHRSYRTAFVGQLASSLFGVVLFFFIAKLVDRVATQGADYFSFVVLGIALLRVVQTTISVFASKLRAEQARGTLEVIVASPVPGWLLVSSGGLYDVLGSLAAAAVMLVAAWVLGATIAVGPAMLVAVVATAATVAIFAGAGLLIGAATVVVKRVGPLTGATTTGLALLGSVYFPVDLLPFPLEWIARLVPLTWALDVIRAALIEGRTVVSSLVWLLVTAAAIPPLAALGLRAAVDRSRRSGTLGHY